jgi:hypothetical protein
MQTFKVHPKGKSAPFELMCQRFEQKDERFVLYTSTEKESRNGFLKFSEVAAIVPQEQPIKNRPFPHVSIEFRVYLKDRQDSPIRIWASSFKMDKDSGITFSVHSRDIQGQIVDEWVMPEVYLAPSEVIAILPSSGLVRED